jgi:hypothetical protein
MQIFFIVAPTRTLTNGQTRIVIILIAGCHARAATSGATETDMQQTWVFSPLCHLGNETPSAEDKENWPCGCFSETLAVYILVGVESALRVLSGSRTMRRA